MVAWEIILLYMIALVQQDHSTALDDIFQLVDVPVFPTLASPVKLLAVIPMSVKIYVAVMNDLLSLLSLTHHVITMVPGC